MRERTSRELHADMESAWGRMTLTNKAAIVSAMRSVIALEEENRERPRYQLNFPVLLTLGRRGER